MTDKFALLTDKEVGSLIVQSFGALFSDDVDSDEINTAVQDFQESISTIIDSRNQLNHDTVADPHIDEESNQNG